MDEGLEEEYDDDELSLSQKNLDKEQIEKVLNSELSLEQKIVKLIRKANLRGGTDNASIAYLEKESGESK